MRSGMACYFPFCPSFLGIPHLQNRHSHNSAGLLTRDVSEDSQMGQRHSANWAFTFAVLRFIRSSKDAACCHNELLFYTEPCRKRPATSIRNARMNYEYYIGSEALVYVLGPGRVSLVVGYPNTACYSYTQHSFKLQCS